MSKADDDALALLARWSANPEAVRAWVGDVLNALLKQNASTMTDDLVQLLAGHSEAISMLGEPYQLGGEDAAKSLMHWTQADLLNLGNYRQITASSGDERKDAARAAGVLEAVAQRMRDEGVNRVGAVQWLRATTA